MPDIKNNIKAIYNALNSEGYKDLGSEQDFANAMQYEEDRKTAYNLLKKHGYSGFGENENEFSSLVYQRPNTNGSTVQAVNPNGSDLGGILPKGQGVDSQPTPEYLKVFDARQIPEDFKVEGDFVNNPIVVGGKERTMGDVANELYRGYDNDYRTTENKKTNAWGRALERAKAMGLDEDQAAQLAGGVDKLYRQNLATDLAEGIYQRMYKEGDPLTNVEDVLYDKDFSQVIADTAAAVGYNNVGTYIEHDLKPALNNMLQKKFGGYNANLHRIATDIDDIRARVSERERKKAEEDRLRKQVEEMKLEGERLQEQGTAMQQQDRPWWAGFVPAAAGGVNAYDVAAQERRNPDADRMVRTGRAIQYMADDAQAAINEDNILHTQKTTGLTNQIKNAFGRVIRGGAHAIADVRTWDFGFTELNNATAVKAAADAYAKNKATAEQKTLLNAVALKNVIMSKHGEALEGLYGAGTTTVQMVPFMAQFAFSPVKGVGPAAQKYCRTQLEKTFGKYATEAVGKFVVKGGELAGRFAGDLAQGAAMTTTFNMADVVADAKNRMTGNLEAATDDKGNIVYSGKRTNVKSGGRAFAEAFAARTIENQSELVGEYLKPLANFMQKGAAKAMDKWGLSKTKDFLTGLNNKQIMKSFNRFTKNTEWNGLFGEVGEEIVGNFENAFTVGDLNLNLDINDENSVFSKKLNTDIILGVGLGCGLISGARVGSYIRNNRKLSTAINDADIHGDVIFGTDRWQQIKDEIDNAPDNKAGELLRSKLESAELNSDQKQTIADYTINTYIKRGNDISQLKNALEGNVSAESEEVMSAYENGHNATDEQLNEVKVALDDAEKNASELLGEEALDVLDGIEDVDTFKNSDAFKSYTREQKEAAVRYMIARTAYKGMIERVQDDINNAVNRSNAEIDNLTHKESESIIRATLKDADREVYIVSGNVAMSADGKNVDTEKSDKNIVVYDTQKGKKEMLDIHDFLSVDAPVDAESFKTDRAEEIKQEIAQREAARIDGVRTFHYDDVVKVQDRDGNLIDGIVQDVQGDEVVVVSDAYQGGKSYTAAELTAMQPRTVAENATVEQQAEEAVAGNESNEAPAQTESEVNSPQVETETEAAQPTEQPSIPTDEKGNLLYHQAPVELTIKDLYDGTLDDAEIADFVSANIEAAQKEYDKVAKKAPKIGTDKGKYLQEKKAYQEEVAEVKRKVDYWKAVETARRKLTHTTKAEVEAKESELNGDAARSEYRDGRDSQSQEQGREVQTGLQGEVENATVSETAQGEVDKEPLSEEAAQSLITSMEENAIEDPEIRLTPQTWLETFGINNSIDTPIGKVRMGENQYVKLQDKKRTSEFGMVSLTLSDPDVIFVEPSKAKGEDVAERNFSYVFAKTFKRNGNKVKYYTSVTVSIDGLEISVSSHFVNPNKMLNKLMEFNREYTKETLFSNSSEMRLAEHQSDVPDLLPTQENNVSSIGKDTQSSQTKQEKENKFSPTPRKDGESITDYAQRVAAEHQSYQERKTEEAKVDTNPTDAQKEAGNYKKGHIKVDGLNITIEQPKGSSRRGTDANGKQWESEMHNTYGYIRGTESVDGDHIDIFLSDNPTEGNVFVVDQINKDGSFDEHKVMYGFPDMESAKQAYLSNYEEGWQGLGSITEVKKEDFKKWIDSSKRKTKPFAEYSTVKTQGDVQTKKPTEANVVENKTDENLSKTEKYVSLQNKSLSDEETRRNPQTTSQNRPRKLGENDAIGLQLKNAGRKDEKNNGRTRLERADRERAEAEKFATQQGALMSLDDLFSLGDIGPSGTESDTYFSPDGYVYKMNYLAHNPLLSDYLKRLSLHNRIFTNTPYELVGFVKSGRSLYPVVRQKNINAERTATEQEIYSYMQKLGFAEKGDGEFSNSEYTIKDIKPKNVFVGKDGQVYVVDAEISKSEAIKPNVPHIIEENVAPADTQTEENYAHNSNEIIRKDEDGDASNLLTDSHNEQEQSEKEAEDFARQDLKELEDFQKNTDTTGRTAIDENRYDAEDLFVALKLDGRPSKLGVLTVVPDKITDPVVQIAVYDYSDEIDDKTNSGWQKWGDLADEYNKTVDKDDKAQERGDTATLGFRTVDAAVKFNDWLNTDGQTKHQTKKSKKESKDNNVFLSQKEYVEKELKTVLKQTRYKTLEEWESKDTGDYSQKYDDLLDAYEDYVRDLADDERLQAIYDKSSVKAQKEMREHLTDADLDYHEFINTSPKRIRIQERLTRKSKYAKGEFSDGTIVSGEVIRWSPTSLTVNSRGTLYTINANKVLQQSDKPMNADEHEYQRDVSLQYSGETLTNDTEAKQKATEAVLAALSKAGIEVVRATDEEVKALLSNSHATTLRTPQGTIYGWSVNGKIYLTEAGINPDTPIHEYTHLWAEAMMIKNKKGWDSIKALLKDNPIWNEVVADANYSNIADNEDAVASEVLSRISGKKNAAKMEEEAQRAIDEAKGVFEKARATTILTNLKKALNNLWKWVSKNIFDVKEFSSINEVTDKVLYDLIHGTKLINDKSLIGVHNISEQKLRKVLKQGGFANPSIAVIDTDKQVHNDYGEISLILPSRKVNKSTGKNVGTYEGDAWTPMYPIIEKQMSSDGSLIMHNDINSVPNEMQSEVRNALNRWLDNGSDTDLSYLYLFQQGKAPKVATVEPKYSNEVYKSLRDIMFGVDSVYNLTKGEVKNLVELYVQTELSGDIDEYNKANERRIAKYKDAIENGRTNSMYYKIAERNLEEVKKYGYPLSSLKTFADDVQRDKTKQGSKNVQKTLDAAGQIIKDAGLEEDFKNWVEGLNNRYQTKEVIFDGFTPTGKRRYIPNTLENVSKLMKKQGRQASTGLGVSFSNFAASVMKANGSLANTRKKKSKLTNEHKDIEDFEEKWKEVYFDLAMKLQPNASTFDDYGFTRLQEAALEADPQAFLSKEYGVTLSKEDVRKLQQMVKAIQEERPAMYFETKFERPVTLNEFSKAVVPEDLSDDLQKTLRDNGIEIFTYKRGDAEDRQKTTQEAAYSSGDIAFQIINNGNNEADNDSDTLYRTVFGGNSGYIGYSLSKRATEAKEEGRYPKTEFKKEYHITEKSLDALTRLGFIDNSEWHHTSMYGNKTPFYGWVEDEFADDYLKHKKEIDALCKGIDPNTKQPLLEKVEKPQYEHDYELPQYDEAETAVNPIKTWRNKQLDEYDKATNFKGYTDATEEEKAKRGAYMQSLHKQMEKKIAEKLAKDFPEYLAAKTAFDAYNNYEENLRKVIGERVKEYLDLDKYSQRWREGRGVEASTDVEELIQHATQTARSLNLDNVEVVADGSIFEDKKAIAKGFYNKKTGKITIIASNHTDIADIEKTVLHEGVAHYGLRKLFGDNFNAFLDTVIVQSEEYVRRKIAEMAAKHEWSFRTAAEEYLAGMAEDANFEQLKPTTWQRIKRLFGEMMSALGLHHSDVTDNDLRYLLWRSYKNLENGGKRSILDMAEDIAMQYRLKVGNYAHTQSGYSNSNILYRSSIDPTENEMLPDAHTRYEKETKEPDKINSVPKTHNFSRRFYKSYVDSMLALKSYMNSVLEATGDKLSSHEDVYKIENAMTSKNKTHQEAYERDYYNPMIEAGRKLCEAVGMNYDALKMYVVAKHGLERNKYMGERAARNDKQVLEAQEAVERAKKAFADNPTDNNEEAIQAAQAAYELLYEDALIEYSKRDYSGLTDLTGEEDVAVAERKAQELVDKVEQQPNAMPKVNAFWKKVNAATKATLRTGYESGIMTKEAYEHIAQMYKYYIPLRGWDEAIASDIYTYYGGRFGTGQPLMKTAGGRSSLAEDPLAMIEHMAQRSIIAANRNKMKQAFLNFTLNHPSNLASVSEQWYVKNALDEWERRDAVIPADATPDEISKLVAEHEQEMQALAEKGEAIKQRNGLKLDKRVLNGEGAEHTIKVWRGGKEYVIYINGNPAVAQAVNGLTNPDVRGSMLPEWAKIGLAKLKNFLSAVYTSFSPAFVFTNFTRDQLFASQAVYIKYGLKYKRQATKNAMELFATGALPKLVHKWEHGTLDTSNQTEKLFDEFMRGGGETGFTALRDIEAFKKDIENAINGNKENAAKRGWKDFLRSIEFANRSAEDFSRFVTYMTSRQQGKSIVDAIYDAKDITVNFNKKGSGEMGARYMNFAYVFFNAAVQSINNFATMAKQHPARTALVVSKFGSLGFGIPMMNAFLMAVCGGDDERYWDNMEWIRRNNILLYVPFTKDTFISIPLPHELRPFYGMGEIATSILFGKETLEGGFVKALEGFTGMLPIDFTGNGGDLATTLTPTVGQPLAQWKSNTDFFGRKVYNDSENKNTKLKPEWTKAFSTTPPILVDITEALNNWTGGDRSKRGRINLNPDVINHLVKGYFGGTAKFVTQMSSLLYKGFSGNTSDIQWRDIPVGSNFVQQLDERSYGSSASGSYKDFTEEAKETEFLISDYKKQVRMGYMEYAEKITELLNSPEYRRYKIAKAYEKPMDLLRETLKHIDDPTDREAVNSALRGLRRRMMETVEDEKKKNFPKHDDDFSFTGEAIDKLKEDLKYSIKGLKQGEQERLEEDYDNDAEEYISENKEETMRIIGELNKLLGKKKAK